MKKVVGASALWTYAILRVRPAVITMDVKPVRKGIDIFIPIKIDNCWIFIHQPEVYTVKTEIEISDGQMLMVGYNPASTLYQENYGRCAWYSFKPFKYTEKE